MSEQIGTSAGRGSRGAASAVGRLPRRARDHLAEPLNRTSLSLVGSTMLTGALGLPFWALAARIYPPVVIGRDGALIAAMLAIAGISQLNLPNVIVRFLPQVRARIGRRVLEAYASAVAVGLLASLAFVILAPLATSRFAFLRTDPLLSGVFVLSTGAWTVFSLQDAVLTALGRAPWLPIENGLFSAAKLLALPAGFLLVGGHGVFAAWVVPMLITVPAISWLIARRVVPEASALQVQAAGIVDVMGWRRLLTFLAQDFVGSAFAQIVMLSLPLLVLSILGAEANAYFYAPFTLVTTFDLLFQAVATSLTTEAARSPARVRSLTHSAFARLVYFQLPISAAIVVAAPWLLALFGPAYVQHGTTSLRLLAAASSFRAVTALFGATARLRGRGLQLLGLQLASLLITTTGLVLLAPAHHLGGVGLSWLLGAAVPSAAVGPSLLRFLRNPSVAGSPPEPTTPAGGRPVTTAPSTTRAQHQET